MDRSQGAAATPGPNETVEQFMRRTCDEQIARLRQHGEEKIREFLAASAATTAAPPNPSPPS